MEIGWKLIKYELRPEAVKIFNNVAVTHYAAKAVWKNNSSDSEDEGNWFKITHTWMRTVDSWQIIGGMGAPITK